MPMITASSNNTAEAKEKPITIDISYLEKKLTSQGVLDRAVENCVVALSTHRSHHSFS